MLERVANLLPHDISRPLGRHVSLRRQPHPARHAEAAGFRAGILDHGPRGPAGHARFRDRQRAGSTRRTSVSRRARCSRISFASPSTRAGASSEVLAEKYPYFLELERRDRRRCRRRYEARKKAGQLAGFRRPAGEAAAAAGARRRRSRSITSGSFSSSWWTSTRTRTKSRPTSSTSSRRAISNVMVVGDDAQASTRGAARISRTS